MRVTPKNIRQCLTKAKKKGLSFVQTTSKMEVGWRSGWGGERLLPLGHANLESR